MNECLCFVNVQCSIINVPTCLFFKSSSSSSSSSLLSALMMLVWDCASVQFDSQ